MKRYFLIAIIGVIITACSYSNDVNENNTNHQIIEHMNKTSLSDDSEQNTIKIVCQKLKAIDFTAREANMDIDAETDALYRKAYLDILKNEIPTIDYEGKIAYFRDLYGIGAEFEELDDYYSYCLNDLDGDELPELGVRSTGYTYILEYKPETNVFVVLYRNPTMYVTIIGTGQIWYHDGLHAGLIRDEYVVLNSENEWETVFKLEQGVGSSTFYSVSIDDYVNVDIGEENWIEITAPFFDMTKTTVPFQSFGTIFGE